MFAIKMTKPVQCFPVTPLGLKLEGFENVVRADGRAMRCDLVVSQLSTSLTWQRDESLLRIALDMLSDEELLLVERAIQKLRKKQNRHMNGMEDRVVSAGDFVSRRDVNGNILVDWNRSQWQDHSPFGFIAENIIPVFNHENLKFMAEFSNMNDIRSVVHMCSMLRSEGIAVNEETVRFHLAVAEHVRVVSMMTLGVSLKAIDLVRAVNKFPDRVSDVVKLVQERGSLDAIDEFMGCAKPLAEGAL
jgi:hypothetical protein